MNHTTENDNCPTCGYYCTGKGGFGCIDKPSHTTHHTEKEIEQSWQEKLLDKGTELGMGDLSLMIGTVTQIRNDAITQALQEERDRLREEIKSMAFVDCAEAGQFAMHNSGYNQAIEAVVELLTPKNP